MIVAFDPGVTTGIAILTDDGGIVDTFAESTLEGVEARCRMIQDLFPGSDVIGEAPPRHGGNYRAYTQSVEEKIKTFFPDAHWANPGQWKGHPAARPDSSLRGHTQHEKDSVGLGRWFKSTRSAKRAGQQGA